MKLWAATALAITLVVAGCGNPADPAIDSQGASAPSSTATTAASPISTSPPAETPAVAAVAGQVPDLAVTEVAFDDHVTITNLGVGSVDLDGLWMCNRPFYEPLPAITLAPGESVEVAAGPLGGLAARGGEAAIYLSDDFEDPGEMLDYVGWGRGGGRARAATEAGLWGEGDVVDPTAGSIVAPTGGSSSTDWASQ